MRWVTCSRRSFSSLSYTACLMALAYFILISQLPKLIPNSNLSLTVKFGTPQKTIFPIQAQLK